MSEKKINIHNLGSLIRLNRKELHLTQSEVAEKVGVTTQHYSRIERGEYIPSLQTFLKIVEVLGLNLSELKIKDENKISATMYEILRLLEDFNNTQQKAVLSFLKTMQTVQTA